jgi:hypothetical protein
MDQTQLTAVERNGHWAVRISWPNGASHHLGKFTSEREASQWIKQHRWLTAKRIEEKDLVRRGRSPGTATQSRENRENHGRVIGTLGSLESSMHK